MARWIKQNDSTYVLPTRDSLQLEGHVWAQSKGIQKDTPHKWKPTESRVVVFISNKEDFKSKLVTRDKEVSLYNDKAVISSRRYNNH